MSKAAKATKAELELRLDQVSGWLCAGQTVRAVTDKARRTWSLTGRQARNYVSTTQGRISDELGEDRAVLVARSLAVYQAVIDKPNSRDFDKIRARSRIDAILGLNSPIQFNVLRESRSRIEIKVEGLPWDKIADEQARLMAGQLQVESATDGDDSGRIIDTTTIDEMPPVNVPLEDAPHPAPKKCARWPAEHWATALPGSLLAPAGDRRELVPAD